MFFNFRLKRRKTDGIYLIKEIKLGEVNMAWDVNKQPLHARDTLPP